MDRESYLLLRFSSMGDVVLATSAATFIKARRPQANVTFATKAAFAPLLDGHPAVDQVLSLERHGGLGGLAKHVRSRRFTAVLDLHANLRSRALGLVSGARVQRWRAGTLDRRLRVWFNGWERPERAPVVSRYADAAAAMLGEAGPASPAVATLVIQPETAAWAGQWLGARGWAGEPLIAVSPGAAWASKRTSAEILRAILAGLPAGSRVLLVGSPAERGLCDELQAGNPGYFNAAGETEPLSRLLALIGRAKAFLGHDSGPLHLAEALGIPSTALFGPTVRAFGFFPQGPGHRVFERDLDCRPCSVHGTERCPLGHHRCLLTLDPSAISAHLSQVLR